MCFVETRYDRTEGKIANSRCERMNHSWSWIIIAHRSGPHSLPRTDLLRHPHAAPNHRRPHCNISDACSFALRILSSFSFQKTFPSYSLRLQYSRDMSEGKWKGRSRSPSAYPLVCSIAVRIREILSDGTCSSRLPDVQTPPSDVVIGLSFTGCCVAQGAVLFMSSITAHPRIALMLFKLFNFHRKQLDVPSNPSQNDLPASCTSSLCPIPSALSFVAPLDLLPISAIQSHSS